MMPFVYIEPELYLMHCGVEIYHCYRSGTNEPWQYWYTPNAEAADDEDSDEWYDVRDFAGLGETTPNVKQWDDYLAGRDEEEVIRELIIKAIDKGKLK